MNTEERFDRIERQMEFVVGQQARQTEQIQQLGDFLLRTARLLEDSARRTEERFGQVADWQRRTDERLNILIDVVERYFSGGGPR